VRDPFDSLRIRPGEPGDLKRVRKDWRLAMATSDFARFLTPRKDWMERASQIYWDWQTDIVDRLLERAELEVACWDESPTSIVGWCVMERGAVPVVHFVAVGNDNHGAYRLKGVAKRLLAPALEQPRVIYTHRTLVCRYLPIPAGWEFDPRRALLPKEK
jgi:hypothetical protein